jgi:outer membrane receptor protein involved in Fe transport
MSKKLTFLIFMFLLSYTCYAQQNISGMVKDLKTAEPLTGASIKCGQVGTTSDFEGKFSLDVEDNCELVISYLGYISQNMRASDASTFIEIKLVESSELLETTIVTASKFEQKLSETTVSVDLLKPSLLKSVNTVKVDALLNKLPGVQVIDGQANIRGGSGFSYGAGSRVMLLLDDMPALQVDAGLANWGDLPVEAMGQIEVVKGAASALYGSSALNGIIHFRRQPIGIKPETNIFTSYTNFYDPEEPKYKWWGDTFQPYRFNIGASHSRKIGKLDILAHGFYTKLESFAKSTYEDSGRGGLTLKYRLKDNLFIGVNTILNKLSKGDFFIWRNALRGIYEPFDGTLTFGKRTRFTIDPYVHYFSKNGGIHKINTRYFYTNNENNANQQNKSGTYYGEYQYSRKMDDKNLNYIIGAVSNLTNSKAELFGDTSYLYTNAAIYLQVEKKIGNNLSTTGGIRYEYNNQKSPDSIGGFIIPGGVVKDGQIISRLGLNYTLSDYSSLRASWGQGYRFPTVTERFISTQFGGFTIFPNPNLTPEYGWSAELGFKQGFKLSAFKGYIDLSGFVSEYEDMIEFTFLDKPFGFKPINVGNTRISGYEASITGQFNIWKIPINLLTGYTYIDPIYKNFGEKTEIKNNLSSNQNVLKYRSKHSAKIDAEASYKFISIGLSAQKYSHVINIDKRFEQPFTDLDLFSIKAFRDQNNKGYTILDARIALKYKDYKLSALLNNIKNIAYTNRPGLLEAPRNASLRLDIKF